MLIVKVCGVKVGLIVICDDWCSLRWLRLLVMVVLVTYNGDYCNSGL